MLKSCRVHTTLPTSDLGRARGFYENILGTPPKTELPSEIFYDCGEGTRFVLSQTAGKPSGAHTQMAFVVEDIESEVRELESRGVVFEHYDLPGLKTVEGDRPSPSAQSGVVQGHRRKLVGDHAASPAARLKPGNNSC